MFAGKTLDAPLSFEDVKNAEHQAVRSGETSNQPAAPLSALCISGGGIRSATFALGVLQGLAEAGVLSWFDYLSTVSGGSYIGSWLTAWKDRLGGLDKILPALEPSAPFPLPNEPDPIQHLREYNNYLSPKQGLFSTDTWTLVATVARNMVLNWLVLAPLFMCVLMAPRLVVSLARLGEKMTAYPVAHEAWIAYLILSVSGLPFAIGTFNILRYLPGVGGTNRPETSFLKYCLAPLILAAVAFVVDLPWIIGGGDENWPMSLTRRQLLVGITSCCSAGWLAFLVFNLSKMWKKYRLLAGLTAGILLTGLITASLASFLIFPTFFGQMGWETFVMFAPPVFWLGLVFPIVFLGSTTNVLEDEDREWFSRAGAWMLLFILFWIVLFYLVLVVPVWVLSLGSWSLTLIVVSGIIIGVGAVSMNSKSQPAAKFKLLELFVPFAAIIFVLGFCVGLVILTNWLLSLTGLVPGDWTDHLPFVENTKTRWALAAAGLFLVFAWIMSRFVDINKFSLHALYRSRLIRAYVGASNQRREANLFTDFATGDDLPMHTLNPALRPFHVVNITLNLVSGKRLAWQQRKAVTFTVTPLHCGSSLLGYRPSSGYARGISLGTAMALSGAAASPNMGRYSSPLIGLIMTLFNARLGEWLGNPGQRGDRTWTRPGPESAVASIVREAFGLTNEDCPYVYLSDGGHFENLGIYEMVKRGCRNIVVLDGGADGEFKFGDLGNALRKIRIDTKIEIVFDEPLAQRFCDRKKRWASATICYKAAGQGEDGSLIYIKPMMCGSEPTDVVSYQVSNPEFPHQSTADQFFDESQTESYRMLGLHSVREMLAGWDQKSFASLVEHCRRASVKASTAEAGG